MGYGGSGSVQFVAVFLFMEWQWFMRLPKFAKFPIRTDQLQAASQAAILCLMGGAFLSR